MAQLLHHGLQRQKPLAQLLLLGCPGGFLCILLPSLDLPQCLPLQWKIGIAFMNFPAALPGKQLVCRCQGLTLGGMLAFDCLAASCCCMSWRAYMARQ